MRILSSEWKIEKNKLESGKECLKTPDPIIQKDSINQNSKPIKEGTFQHYLSARIPELTREQPNLKQGERMKIISAEWRNIKKNLPQ